MNLIELKPGTGGIITSVKGTGQLRQRLFDMGLMPRKSIYCQRVAPLGFPIWVKLGESQICLRKKEADLLEIAPAHPACAE